MTRLAVIPARGGSRRIPRKNIRLFHGRPMLAYSIEAAWAARVFDAVIVSTEDEEIGEIARQCGAETPFRRPLELADDHSDTIAVTRHAIRWWTENRGPVSEVCSIYATAPFLEPSDLRAGLELLLSHSDADFVYSVTTYDFPIFRALKLGEDGAISMLWPEHEFTRSQDFPAVCHDAGQFYWGRPRAFDHNSVNVGARSYAVVIPRSRAQDIDTLEDWEVAERVWLARKP